MSAGRLKVVRVLANPVKRRRKAAPKKKRKAPARRRDGGFYLQGISIAGNGRPKVMYASAAGDGRTFMVDRAKAKKFATLADAKKAFSDITARLKNSRHSTLSLVQVVPA